MVSERHTEEFDSRRLKALTDLVNSGESIFVPEDLQETFREAFNIDGEGHMHIVRYRDEADPLGYRIALLPNDGGRARKSYAVTDEQLRELMQGRAENLIEYNMHCCDLSIEAPQSLVRDVTDMLADAAQSPWGGKAIAELADLAHRAGQRYQLQALFELYVESCGQETADDPGAVGKLTTEKETKSLSCAMRKIYGAMHDAIVVAKLRLTDTRDFTYPGDNVFSSFESLLLCEAEVEKVNVESLREQLYSG